MAELANFLPTIGTPPSSGGDSFNTITVNTSVAASVGEAIFVDHTGTFFTEGQLRSYNHEISTNSNNYPPRITHNLTSLTLSGGGPGVLALDPDSYFSCVPVGTSITADIDSLNNGSFFSCRLGSGFWMVIGFGGVNQGSRPASESWTATMVVSILSADGTTVLTNNKFNANQIMSVYTDPATFQVRVLAVYPFTDSVKLLLIGRTTAGASYQGAMLTLTRNTSTNVVTSSTSSFSGLVWGGDNTMHPPICTEPLFVYNSVPYFISLNGTNQVTLVNLNTNAVTNISIPGLGRWEATSTTSPELVRAVVAGTSLHLYRSISGTSPPAIINLTNMTSPSSGLATSLTSNRFARGNILKLDATTYAFGDSTNWYTVRHSADGLTTATYSSVASGITGLLFAANLYGTTYLVASGNSTVPYNGNAGVVGSLSYDSGAGTSSIVAIQSSQDTLPDLLKRLPLRVGSNSLSINILANKYMLPVGLELGMTTNNRGKLIYHVFSPRHYTRLLPGFIGRATTTGTAPTVLLAGTAKKYTGAVAGTLYAGEIMGLPSEYAIMLKPTTLNSRPLMSTVRGVSGGTAATDIVYTMGNNSNYVESNLGEARLTGASSYLITTSYRPNRVLIGQAVSGITTSGCTVAAVYVCNGRIVYQWGQTSNQSGVSNSQNTYDMRWDWATWPTLIGLTYAGSTTNDGQTESIIIGTYREYEV